MWLNAAYGFERPKVAVIVSAAVSVKVQVVVPVQPVQLVKLLLAPGVSVRVMDVPDAKLAVQVPVVQLIPGGWLVTAPVPVPAKVTVRTTCGGGVVKAALTDVAAVIVTVQVAVVPEQAPPLQPVNVLPVAGVAVSITAVLGAKLAVHEPDGQLIPPTLLVTVPKPVTDTVSASCPAAVNVAPTV